MRMCKIVVAFSTQCFVADCLHGDMTGNARADSLARFRARKFDVLVATDVAARGLDLPVRSS